MTPPDRLASLVAGGGRFHPMEPSITQFSVWFLLSIGLAAVLYSSVGQGGASGYLAVMALFGVDPAVMKPAALVMNIAVTALILWRLRHQNLIDWNLFGPLAISSVPLAFLGGAMTLEQSMYRIIVGVALCLAAIRLIGTTYARSHPRRPVFWQAAIAGGGSGFLGGLTGIGGGIFLAPLLLFLNWSTTREIVGLAAGFVLVNSVAGVGGYLTTVSTWPSGIPLLVIAALVGTLFGSEIARRHATPTMVMRILGVVLIAAAVRMIVSATY